jgi:NADH dehydrogenase
MGRLAARNVLRRMRGEPTQPFRYRDYGVLATIGRNSAVVQLQVGRRQLRWSGALGLGVLALSPTSTS